MEKIIILVLENKTIMKVVGTIILTAIILIVTKISISITYKINSENGRYYHIKKRINYLSGILIIVGIVAIWIDSAENFITYVGLLSAGLAIALKEVFTGMAGWMFIESRKLFVVGHRIAIADYKGDVIDRRLFQFSLMEVSSLEEGEQSTGRIIDVPNSLVFTYALINYTKGFEYIWNEIRVLVTFESDWRLAKKYFLEIANKDTEITSRKAAAQLKNATKKYMIHYNKLTPIVYTDIKESGIQLTIRYLCEPKLRRVTTNKIWEDILEVTEKNHNIEFAYPTKRVINDGTKLCQ